MEKNDNFKVELENQYNILIKANQRKEQKRYICILIILISTLISVLVSIIFSYQAYRSSKNLKDSNLSEENIYYETISVKYNNTNNLKLSNIGNGYKLSDPFTIEIKNEGNTDITYNIKISSIQTSLLSTNNLVFTLTENNQKSISKELPLSDKIISNDIKISPGETYTYRLEVSFNGTMEVDNYNNYYNAKILVEPQNNKSDLLE